VGAETKNRRGGGGGGGPPPPRGSTPLPLAADPCPTCVPAWRYEPLDPDETPTLRGLLHALWDALGSGVWLEPGDYEALRDRYNELAQAAEDAALVGRRVLPQPDGAPRPVADHERHIERGYN
jgi:hypothetical protein